MPNWYFSKEDLLRTPSRLDGIDYMTEIRYRREGTRFIMNCGNRMRLYPFAVSDATPAFSKGFLCLPFRLRWQNKCYTAVCCMLLGMGPSSMYLSVIRVGPYVYACSMCMFDECKIRSQCA